MKIHPQAIVSPQAVLGQDVTIGPFCVVESDVIVGDGCTLGTGVILKDGTTLGAQNTIFDCAVLGGLPQHLRMPEHLGRLVLGSHNTVREHCTLHRALHVNSATTLGDHNLLMVGAHVAHDCHIGSNTIIANNALLAGHVTIGDRGYISGAVGIHQFCRIGKFAMVGGMSRVVQDIPPYVTVDGGSGHIVGLNLVGLRRNGFTPEQIADLKTAYRLIYRAGLKWKEVLEALARDFSTGPAAEFHAFLSVGKRGFAQERRMPPGATLKIRSTSEEEEASVPRTKAG